MAEPQKLADQLPGPTEASQCSGDDTQAFAERMTAAVGHGDTLAAVLEFSRLGHHGMALYVCGQLARKAAYRANYQDTGGEALTCRAQLQAFR